MYAFVHQEIDMHFSISRPEDTGFRTDGPRDYFEYRDLGIRHRDIEHSSPRPASR